MTRCLPLLALSLLALSLLAPAAAADPPPGAADLFVPITVQPARPGGAEVLPPPARPAAPEMLAPPGAPLLTPGAPLTYGDPGPIAEEDDCVHDHDHGPAEHKRGLFESDRAFEGFIGPITNPVLTKDPRSLTEFRFLFVDDYIPSEHALFHGGDFQVFGFEVRVALTDRLTFIADKDGFASIHPHAGHSTTGSVNI